ncbi:MAG TPA: hypothetical protein VFH36_02565 [Acidimicrobiales bacterium]|nr:hypothetical protein [Acidimicrobiales bacterium]
MTAFGDLPREPLSDHYGLDRGTPVDRRYIEGFLSARRGVIHGTYPNGDFWRFTPAGIAELFGQHWPSDFTVDGFGNLRTCTAFLMGEVVEDLPDVVLDDHDPRFPLTVAVEATKASSARPASNPQTTL